MVKKIEAVNKRKLEQMSFESTAEGRVGVDGADRWRKTVPHVGTADGESPSSELGPSSLYRGCSGRSGAELPMRVGWAERDEVSQERWTATMTPVFCFYCVKNRSISIIFVRQHLEETCHLKLQTCPSHLQIVAALKCKKLFFSKLQQQFRWNS